MEALWRLHGNFMAALFSSWRLAVTAASRVDIMLVDVRVDTLYRRVICSAVSDQCVDCAPIQNLRSGARGVYFELLSSFQRLS